MIHYASLKFIYSIIKKKIIKRGRTYYYQHNNNIQMCEIQILTEYNKRKMEVKFSMNIIFHEKNSLGFRNCFESTKFM